MPLQNHGTSAAHMQKGAAQVKDATFLTPEPDMMKPGKPFPQEKKRKD